MTKKSFWDNSSLQQDITWDNQELPGCPDEILLIKNWNRVEGNKQAAITRETSEEFKRKRLEAIIKSNSTPEYRKKFLEGNSKKLNDSKFWENYYKGIKKRDSNPEYHKKRINASNSKICKKVHTPLGIFDSITLAAKAHNMSNSEAMRYRIKSSNFPDYYIIE